MRLIDTVNSADEELADLIHKLNDLLEERLKTESYKGLKGQLDSASILVRSWSSNVQKNMNNGWRET